MATKALRRQAPRHQRLRPRKMIVRAERSLPLGVGPGDPGYKVSDSLGYIIQGKHWNEVFFVAKQHCWIVFARTEIFGTNCEELFPGRALGLKSLRPYGEKTECAFTDNPPTRLKAAMSFSGTMQLLYNPTAGYGGPGPIHTIPPLIG